MIKYLVVWMTGDLDRSRDHYESFETLKEARARYQVLINEARTYSANICRVIESSDYLP